MCGGVVMRCVVGEGSLMSWGGWCGELEGSVMCE